MTAKNIPIHELIPEIYGHQVLRLSDVLAQADQLKFIKLFEQAMHNVCATVRKYPIHRPRPNEVGNDKEPYVMKALIAQGVQASSPAAKSGQGKVTGYPDLQLNWNGFHSYLEVKTYAKKNKTTTQRSFYLSPSDDPKVVKDSVHLLVGFEIERNGNSFWPVGFELLDLYELKCDMKIEYNSDNKRLYQSGLILSS